MNLSSEEFLNICLELEEHHAVFYQLWAMGKPVFDDRISTAAVSFDKQGRWVEFIFNPNFWKSLNTYQRKFVICHECLHVILNHGVRTKSAIGKNNQDIINFCLDVVVNESLIRSFGFERDKLDTMDIKICWTDTVFPQHKDMPTDASFEYYFNQIPKEYICDITTLDDHSRLGDSEWEEVIEDLNGKLTIEEKSAISGTIQKHYQEESNKNSRGEGCGNWVFINIEPVKKKKKWESVIKRWSRKYDKPEFKDVEQWARLNRRFAFLSSTGLMLPSEMEIDHETEGKIQVWFFQDTSGSCWHLKDRFFKAARSLNPKKFDIRLFSFDTRVKEVDIEKGKIYGGGGTSFDILETKIQQEIINGKYPEAVFIITDGYGNNVKPEKPERWYVFLTTSCVHYFPKECNFFQLKDYE